jgi:hypothetical protein
MLSLEDSKQCSGKEVAVTSLEFKVWGAVENYKNLTQNSWYPAEI